MISTQMVISSTSLSYSFDYCPILGSTLQVDIFLPPQCLVFNIRTQNSIKNANLYSMEGIKSYSFDTTRLHLLFLVIYLYLYYKISKVPILLVLMALSIHKNFIIMSYSWSNMDKLLSLFNKKSFSMASIAIAILYCLISSALITNSNCVFHYLHSWSITFSANSLFLIGFSFTLYTNNFFVIFKPLN